MREGFVALVGAGPGDMGLLTLRGKELIERADVVVYDRLVSEDILRLIPEKAKRINVGKESSNHPVPQNEINEILLKEAEQGNTVVRLKGGDPFVFGRGGEELELIVKNRIPFEVVPGITSAIAVPLYGGIPVTHRDYCSSLHIITGHQKENEPLKIDFKALASTKGTLIFLMGVASLKQIADGLISAGVDRNIPAAIIENGTSPMQRRIVSALEELDAKAADCQIKSPAIIIVGKVCSLARDYDWFTARPLFGKKVIVTRPFESEGVLSRKLKELGAQVYDFPCIKIEELPDNTELSGVLTHIDKYSWLAFTSKHGVRLFFEALRKRNEDLRILGHMKIAAVGSQTAKELLGYGIIADCVPKVFDGKHLGMELCARTDDKDNILLIRAENGSPDILKQLDEAKRKYDDVSIYRTKGTSENKNEESMEELIRTEEKVYVTFTSASTVEGFVNKLKDSDKSKIIGICIGEQTSDKATEYGIDHVVSEIATIDSLIEKLLEESR